MPKSSDAEWEIDWNGHPDGLPRVVRVRFMADAKVPSEKGKAGLVEQIARAGSEEGFEAEVWSWAYPHNLRVAAMNKGTSHGSPFGSVITIVFEKTKPPFATVDEES
jgi:hypothetical protein